MINPDESVGLYLQRAADVDAFAHRFTLVRLALRRGLLLPDAPRLLLLAQQNEIHAVLTVWQRIPHRQRLTPIDSSRLQRRLDQPEQPLLVAVSSDVHRDPSHRSLLERLEMRDPRIIRSVSVLSLFEQQQERLPPALMGDISFTFDAYHGLPHSVCRPTTYGYSGVGIVANGPFLL